MNRFKLPSPTLRRGGELSYQMLRTIAIFQAITAFPISIFLGFRAFLRIFFPSAIAVMSSVSPFDTPLFYYGLITDLLSSLMASGIIFIVIVQRRTILDIVKLFRFEIIKSILATSLWLWLLFDSLFGPWQRLLGDKPELIARAKKAKVARAVTSVIVLILLFYSALTYVYMQWKRERKFGNRDYEMELEDRETLLGEEDDAFLGRVD